MLKVLELYSGIGGFHYALKECGLPSEVVAAADINNVANHIYKHNFPETKIIQRSIEALTVKDLDKLSPDFVHMSPPCQPFVRVGKQQDAGDARTKSFLHLIDVIPQMKKRPKYIFLENVRGFDTSETRTVLLKMLQERAYITQEFLLSPVQFGVPNSRLRYYLLAKLRPLTFGFEMSDKIMDDLPSCTESYLVHRAPSYGNGCHKNPASGSAESISSQKVTCPSPDHSDNGSNETQQGSNSPSCIDKCTAEHVHEFSSDSNYDSDTRYNSNPSQVTSSHLSSVASNVDQNSSVTSGDASAITDLTSTDNSMDDSDSTTSDEVKDASLHLYKKYQDICKPLSDYLESGPGEYLESFLVQPKFLPHFWVMDIVKPEYRNACCFTKRYGHHIEGAGSVIQTVNAPNVDLSLYKRDRVYTQEVARGVESLHLRFFTPREIANMMCFPSYFEFPTDVTTKQCYRALGNSLNVHVVAVLLRLLLLGDDLSSVLAADIRSTGDTPS